MALNFVLVVQTGQLPGLSLNYLWLLLPVHCSQVEILVASLPALT